MGISAFASEWASELLAIFIWSVILWLLSHAPDKYKIHKRFLFWIFVKKAITEINMTLTLRGQLSESRIQKLLQPFWSAQTTNVDESNPYNISFDSTLSGGSYEIKYLDDEEQDKKMITVKCFNGLSIGYFGGLKGFDETINEFQKLSEIFRKDMVDPESITVDISITPRTKRFLNSQLGAEVNGANYSSRFTVRTIHITNKGFSSIKNNVSSVLYGWMVNYLHF